MHTDARRRAAQARQLNATGRVWIFLSPPSRSQRARCSREGRRDMSIECYWARLELSFSAGRKLMRALLAHARGKPRFMLHAASGVAWSRTDDSPPAGVRTRAALNRETRENRENRETRCENRLENT